LRLVLVGQLTDRETTMYTKYDDGGDWDRKTSSNNFDGDYPDKFKSLTWANENRGAICAVPWRYRKFKEDLIKLPDGTTIQRYALNFPWVDAPDVRRIPCDRVPYRDKWGNLVPQRERFDMYVHMPKKQAFKWGHPVAPILVYEWKLVEVGNE